MGDDVGRVVAAAVTGGLSEAYPATVKGLDKLSGAKANRDAIKDASNRQLQEQQRLQDEAKLRTTNEAAIANETSIQQQARAKQRAITASLGGRKGTILTGPAGAPVPTIGGATTGKTLIGS